MDDPFVIFMPIPPWNGSSQMPEARPGRGAAPRAGILAEE
jgi:hypothetical protein